MPNAASTVSSSSGLMSQPAVIAPTKRRRGAIPTANRHWTDALAESEHATTRLGARFHLRKLFLRQGVDEFSQSELEFITQYLVNETTIAEQPWWAALTVYEQLEIVNMLELHHVAKGEDTTLWFSSRETSKDCILLYGSAEAKPTDTAFAPVLKFTEGSVVGNMRLPTSGGVMPSSDQQIDARRGSITDALPPVAVSANASAETWRRVKREQAFRNSLHFYTKLRIIGPADYFVLTSTEIAQTTAKAAERLERERLMRLYGLERFLGCIRKKTFESGAVLATEGERLGALYFVLEGECRASVRVDDLVEEDAFAEKTNSTLTMETMLRHSAASPRRITQLPIASLGPRSLVGDVSMLLGLSEPATIQATTVVVVLALSHDDYVKESGDMRNPEVAAPIETMRHVALETMGFVLDRLKAEAAYNNCDQTTKVQSLTRAMAEKQAEVDTPQSRHLLEKASSFTRPAAFKHFSSSVEKSSPIPRDRASPNTKPKVPSVVQQYLSQKSPRNAGSLAPVILSKRRDLTLGDGSSTLVTREQRKAVLVLNGVHSPLAAKSLRDQWSKSEVVPRRDEDADEDNSISVSSATQSLADAEDPEPKQVSIPQDQRRQRAIDDHLFLFPTLTRQRQLHARSLPLLPRYRGVVIHNR